jgi:hypothetical protein
MVRKERKKRKNCANRFAAVLFVALIVNLGLYGLPDSIFGLKIKKVDLLSDIRKAPQDHPQATSRPDSENRFFTVLPADTTSPSPLPADPPPPLSADSTPVATPPPPAATAPSLSPQNTGDDLTGTLIQDFSADHTGLQHFFDALRSVDRLQRPVRIAFLGDSFIEGDILVADFRAKMQARFGGRGVGFIPVTSNVAQYRPTIRQSAGGWTTYSIIKNRNRRYVLSGLLFEAASDRAFIRFQTVDLYPGLEEVSSLKFIYSGNRNTSLLLKSNRDTSRHELPPADGVTQYEIEGTFTSATLQFRNVAGLQAIGLALEDNRGVTVDNFALRSNSGIIMSGLDREQCRDLQRIRPYDLIIMQYGLNVASDSIREYAWYGHHMVAVVEHLRDCFPGADLLILSVSDRSHKRGGAYRTMPAVPALLRTQRQIARETGTTFWNTFAAMGGTNSMIEYVRSNRASKDYTHLNFRGGRDIAQALFDAIMTEKKSYEDNDSERLAE